MLATYGSQTKYIFHLDGFVSLQNSGIWGSENPHVTEPLSLHSPKISKQIGPFFFKATDNCCTVSWDPGRICGDSCCFGRPFECLLAQARRLLIVGLRPIVHLWDFDLQGECLPWKVF